MILPVTVSFSGFSQSKMTKEGHPSTVTTVRLEGGFCGGLVAFPSKASSLGNRLTESVMEQGLLSGFGMYRTWGPRREGHWHLALFLSKIGGGELISIIVWGHLVSHYKQMGEAVMWMVQTRGNPVPRTHDMNGVGFFFFLLLFKYSCLRIYFSK